MTRPLMILATLVAISGHASAAVQPLAANFADPNNAFSEMGAAYTGEKQKSFCTKAQGGSLAPTRQIMPASAAQPSLKPAATGRSNT